MDFLPFKKIPRLFKLPMLITEKIDGTNAQIAIEEDGVTLYVGARNGWLCKITSDGPVIETTDYRENYGFAYWAKQHYTELLALGPGHHYGEWWGSGIQRNYGLDYKKFSLFNTGRWSNERPECCSVVPVLYCGEFNQDKIEEVKDLLKVDGSVAVPGFMNPEGIVLYLPKDSLLFKSTYDGDSHKGNQE